MLVIKNEIILIVKKSLQIQTKMMNRQVNGIKERMQFYFFNEDTIQNKDVKVQRESINGQREFKAKSQ